MSTTNWTPYLLKYTGNIDNKQIMLHFFVQIKKKGTKSFHWDSHDVPTTLPSCVLVQNDGWNDYSSRTWFSLFYYDAENNRKYIGELKLMNDECPDTYEVIKEGFDKPLDKHFCSLGMETSFYYNLLKNVEDKAIREEILIYLSDCTFNKLIYEEYRDHVRFKESLIRDMAAQEALNAAEYILNSDDPDTAFSFIFDYHPKYDVTKMARWEVTFSQKKPSFLRTVGVIGENGVGKTMLLTSFVEALLQNKLPETLNKKPLFQSCVAICSSDRDGQLQIVSQNNTLYRSYCLRQKDDDTYASMLGAIEEVILERPMLYGTSVSKLYYETLIKHLGSNFIDGLFCFDESDYTDVKTKLNREKLQSLIDIFSSGQLQMFEMITYLYAHIHLSSLIIFDEPEVHMHPSLIMNFMPLLNRLLKEFKSFAIICTHSPLVVRELVQKNVYRMSIDAEMNPSINRVGFRTFGEDISVLYKQIFEYDETKSYFRQVIRNVITQIQEHPKKYHVTCRQEYIDEIVRYLEQDMELGLMGRCAIRDLVYEMVAE